MKRRPPGLKPKKSKLPPPSVSASFLVGDVASEALQALMDRMVSDPSTLIYFDDGGMLEYLRQSAENRVSRETLQIQDECETIQPCLRED